VRRAAMDFFSLLFVGAAARETVIWFEVFAAVGARCMENTHKHTFLCRFAAGKCPVMAAANAVGDVPPLYGTISLTYAA
jgi:predicted lysophospholipase L1 biosynthesis ABC-type transport system permease subunit